MRAFSTDKLVLELDGADSWIVDGDKIIVSEDVELLDAEGLDYSKILIQTSR